MPSRRRRRYTVEVRSRYNGADAGRKLVFCSQN